VKQLIYLITFSDAKIMRNDGASKGLFLNRGGKKPILTEGKGAMAGEIPAQD
jgi:hypothetical protein